MCKEHGWTPAAASLFLIDRMEAWSASPAAADDVLGSLHPSTWLSSGRYDDDEECWSDVANPFALGSEAHRAREEEDKKLKHQADKKAREADFIARQKRNTGRF